MIICMDFVAQEKLSILTVALKDLALTLFLNEGFLQGWAIAEATTFLAAMICKFPELSTRSCLSRARRALQGWKNMDPGRTRPPLHWFLVSRLALQMLESGNLQECLCMLFLFETYCRPIEAFKVLERHSILPPTSKHYVIHLHSSDFLETSKVGMQDHSLLLGGPTMPWLGASIAKDKKLVPDHVLFRTDYTKLRRTWEDAWGGPVVAVSCRKICSTEPPGT